MLQDNHFDKKFQLRLKPRVTLTDLNIYQTIDTHILISGLGSKIPYVK